jgi:DNA-binding MarR family transcriptional regulator
MAKGKSGTKGGVAALERSPSHLLHRALQLALDLYAAEFGPGAITQRQYAVLAAAADHEGATQTDLVRITGIDRSTLADMVARMIAKGLLERERAAHDARANAVRLTEQGREALAQARPKVAAADAKLLKLIGGGGRRDAFVDLLRRLIRSGEEPPAKAVKAPKPAKPVAAKPKAAKKKAKAPAKPAETAAAPKKKKAREAA